MGRVLSQSFPSMEMKTKLIRKPKNNEFVDINGNCDGKISINDDHITTDK